MSKMEDRCPAIVIEMLGDAIGSVAKEPLAFANLAEALEPFGARHFESVLHRFREYLSCELRQVLDLRIRGYRTGVIAELAALSETRIGCLDSLIVENYARFCTAVSN